MINVVAYASGRNGENRENLMIIGLHEAKQIRESSTPFSKNQSTGKGARMGKLYPLLEKCLMSGEIKKELKSKFIVTEDPNRSEGLNLTTRRI
jgi:hypothetical protein